MKKNRKLCWNCDGSVHIHATKCPYCGSDLVAEQPSQPLAVPPAPKVQTQSSSLPPPPPPPYVRQVAPALPPEPEPLIFQPTEQANEPKRGNGGFISLLLLLPGAFFLLFAFLLLLFAKEGLLSLEWKAKYWWIYLSLSIPMLYFGWRFLKVDEESTSNSLS
ncbi:MAG: hypothetical protein JSR80_04400 [Verrucomicrobia bacterium]|nr:hypothetical protein [Verrucomicrobiota bacterium]